MRIEGNELVIDAPINKQKITGHSFVGLIGFDPFKSIGDTLLTMHKIVKEEVDPKWLKRGNFAEKVILTVYQREHKCVTYDPKQIHYDNFSLENFGGLIDIELPEERTLIEVKSKSMKDYDYITFKQPQQEVYQGLYYGFLRGYSTITMEWVFFDEKTEDEIFNDKAPTTLKYLKKFSKTYTVNHDVMKDLLTRAYQINKEFEETGRINLNWVSNKMLEKLGLSRPDMRICDLPF